MPFYSNLVYVMRMNMIGTAAELALSNCPPHIVMEVQADSLSFSIWLVEVNTASQG